MTSNNKPRRGALCTRPIVNPDALRLVHGSQRFRGGPIPLSGIRLSGIPPSGIAELRMVTAVRCCARTKISMKRRTQQSLPSEQVFSSVLFVALFSYLFEPETAEGRAFIAEYPPRTISKTERDGRSTSRYAPSRYTWRRYTSLRRSRERATHLRGVQEE